MLTATLGGLIKDYRLKKRLSQMEVSLRIGWKDTSRLSKIEQGRVGKPTRETIDKVIKALDLSEQEKGEFLFTGGYLPTDQEIKKVIEAVRDKIQNWPHPAVFIDFSWRCLLINQATVETFGFPRDFINQVPIVKPNLLEMVIAPKTFMPVDIFKGDDEKNLKPFPIAQTAQFKFEQTGRENDSWYKKLIGKLTKNPEFRKIWASVDQSIYHKKLLDYEYKEIKWPNNEKPEQKYHVFSSRLITDQRFQLTLYLPAK
ncbi:MAG: transcriptional regulator, XRE family [uncultured bacterium]|uniref:HTH cro/C1-type domain-containing protein n=1 Tax=Candidatus Daviesbacteria bacterium GW2011_GWC2_40_12 TaxID=1618431 RepID=A0A0G0QNE3_9BACT|nr:MAG: transcriptional regulator, XRE family [uncultured bacterium]KKQ81490.1 MAG: hypothetical protein UT04_C0072G0004 [Candidatus Daviesbacteria bacterium GW2011_GWF2_38_7]KKR16065.1 MAG: hypothetical protein UT45_C0009G0005 [Candidatus Daviesbacteria bacterium GW2011_GWA2_39_33]KKR41633.1 MAG: hypothetical protein UT77_C0008G0005 [Candidatus Daviesbacteria bacterium GW2011_GWC2_40_12]OGE22190.1 MAG: hypothetical protein A2778_03530 [Candidatus Daviesbacteria bacterium RIFCSPHIGHO2_01_FULL_4